MAGIGSNIRDLRNTIPSSVRIVAVSKTKPVEAIMEAYKAGQRIFGENRAQELAEKQKLLPPDIEWHMIGHLQTNKVKYIAGVVDTIHSVDSIRLLRTIDNEAMKRDRVVKCLLQFHIAKEETKSGFFIEEAREIFDQGIDLELGNVVITGVMGMATFTDDDEAVRNEFRSLREIFDTLRDDYPRIKDNFTEISSGMSGDYLTAIGEGSTMVRIGSIIFGERTKT